MVTSVFTSLFQARMAAVEKTFTFSDQHVSVSPTYFSMESLILAVFFSLPPLAAFTLNQAQATLSFFTAITWNSYRVWACVH